MFDHKTYNRERYQRRRAEAIIRLGGKCANCGSAESLEFDHIDPLDKSIEFGKMLNFSKERYESELEKAQLLCRGCHKNKTIAENSVPHGGGLTGKRNCRCELCAPLKNAYRKRY